MLSVFRRAMHVKVLAPRRRVPLALPVLPLDLGKRVMQVRDLTPRRQGAEKRLVFLKSVDDAADAGLD